MELSSMDFKLHSTLQLLAWMKKDRTFKTENMSVAIAYK
jgi:hypothetical protein